MSDSPLIPRKTIESSQALELIKIYRDFARYYFGVRSSVSYINIATAAGVTYFYAQRLIESSEGGFVCFIRENYWMYAVGCIAFIAFATWATSICNLLSNSIFSYLIMAQDLEVRQFDVSYPRKKWATTFEFLTVDAQEVMGKRLVNGNVWNILNAFLAIYGVFALALVSALSSNWKMLALVFVIGSIAVYVVTDKLVETVSPQSKPRGLGAWIILVVLATVILFVALNCWSAVCPLGVQSAI